MVANFFNWLAQWNEVIHNVVIAEMLLIGTVLLIVFILKATIKKGGD